MRRIKLYDPADIGIEFEGFGIIDYGTKEEKEHDKNPNE